MNEYTINKVTDFLLVPEDRREDCLRGFAGFLAVISPLMDAAVGASKECGLEDVCNDAIDKVKFVWIDDGKEDIFIHAETEEGVQCYEVKGVQS